LRGNFGGSYSSADYVSGQGDYVVKKNTLYTAADLGNAPPKVVNVGREAFVLRHREFLGDLLSGSSVPTLFNLQTFALNPGNLALFPFAAPIAQRFQEYEITGMFIELKTLAADFSTQFALGSVFMATDYNVLNPAPTSKQQLENMEYSNSCKPSCSLIHWIECDPANTTLGSTHRYIATNGDYQGGDRRLYDLGNIYIGSQGLPNDSAHIAEIWVSYEIALYKPIIEEDPLQVTGIGCRYNFTNPLATAPLGTEESFWGYSGFLFTSNRVEIPPILGYYLITVTWRGGPDGNITPGTPDFGVSGSASLVDGMWPNVAGTDPTAIEYYQCADGRDDGTTMMMTMIVHIQRPASGPFVAGAVEFADSGAGMGTFWPADTASGNVSVIKISETNVGL